MTDTIEIDLARILRAAAFAADRHRYQKRKDKDATPYVNHPLAVADVLAGVGGVTDVDVLVAALLHDTVEDTDTSPEEIERLFGATVRQLVDEVSDDKSLPKAERKQLQVEHAATASDEAKLLKLGDKICNVSDVVSDPPADWPTERRREYLDWSEQVVAGCRGTNGALEARFDELVGEGRTSLA